MAVADAAHARTQIHAMQRTCQRKSPHMGRELQEAMLVCLHNVLLANGASRSIRDCSKLFGATLRIWPTHCTASRVRPLGTHTHTIRRDGSTVEQAPSGGDAAGHPMHTRTKQIVCLALTLGNCVGEAGAACVADRAKFMAAPRAWHRASGARQVRVHPAIPAHPRTQLRTPQMHPRTRTCDCFPTCSIHQRVKMPGGPNRRRSQKGSAIRRASAVKPTTHSTCYDDIF